MKRNQNARNREPGPMARVIRQLSRMFGLAIRGHDSDVERTNAADIAPLKIANAALADLKAPSRLSLSHAPPLLPQPPRIASAVAACLVFLGCFFVGALLLAGLGVYPAHEAACTLFIQGASWALAIGFALKKSRSSLAEACPHTPFPHAMIPGMLFFTVGLFLIAGAIAARIPMPDAFAEAAKHLQSSVWMIFLIGVVLAPVVEEVFFRGWMLRGFLHHYPERKAILVSAAVFALVHLNPWQAIMGFPAGVFFAWLTLRLGSIIPGMICHAFGNGMFMIVYPALLKLADIPDEEFKRSPTPGDWLWLVFLSSVLIAAGVWWMRRYLPERIEVRKELLPLQGATLTTVQGSEANGSLTLTGDTPQKIYVGPLQQFSKLLN